MTDSDIHDEVKEFLSDVDTDINIVPTEKNEEDEKSRTHHAGYDDGTRLLAGRLRRQR